MGASAQKIVEEFGGLFVSSHAALVFAFNYSGQCYDRPMMNRMAAPASGSGNGLVGLDGAAQAGMIRAELAVCGRVAEAVLTVRVAPRSLLCSCRRSCCTGRKPNAEWREAVSVLADQARHTALAGCTSTGITRRELVALYFGGSRLTVADLAEDSEQARRTIAAHLGKVRRWLKDEEARAWTGIEGRLAACGMITPGSAS